MRPLRPFCGTVLKAQLLTLPATIKTSANGVVTTQLSFLPPASSSATDVLASSESRPATAQPPEPPPTTTKSNVSLIRVPLSLLFVRHSGSGACAPSRNDVLSLSLSLSLRQQPHHLLQPRDLRAIGRIEIGKPVEPRAVEHRLQLGQRAKTPFAVIGAGAGGADAAHR